jgi:hypothetical protein
MTKHKIDERKFYIRKVRGLNGGHIQQWNVSYPGPLDEPVPYERFTHFNNALEFTLDCIKDLDLWGYKTWKRLMFDDS